METLIPPFNPHDVLVAPWTENLEMFGWIALMGFLVTLACGLIGNYLILRRMALVGDAISHSVLPGIAVAFLLSHTRDRLVMFAGALAAGALTTLLIEVIHRRTRVKQDAAIGIVFSTLFAIGVILITLFASQIDLDVDCVLYGEISFVPLEPRVVLWGWSLGPESVVAMGLVAAAVLALIILFYKELLVSSFDAGLAASLGIRPALMHYCLMAALSIVVVSAFQAVGAILVVAMLILPGATSYLLTSRLAVMLLLSAVHAAISSVAGMHLAIWLNCSMAGAMVLAGTTLFILAWIFSPTQGLLWRKRRTQADAEPLGTGEAAAS
jgi:manganese/zinc/iron transport system permease protein